MAAHPMTSVRGIAAAILRVRSTSSAQAALVVVALLPVLAYLVVAGQRVGYPYELTYFEGSTVELTARVVAGQPLYASPTTQFTPWPYPPLYFWLTGALAHVTGVSLLPMRLVSFVASLVVLGLIVTIVRRASGSTVGGVTAAGLYAATYRVSGAWADTARVDSLLLALLLGAVLVGMRVRGWRGGVALGAMLFLAFLTKQNALVVAVPMLLSLFVRRRPVGVAAAATLTVGVLGSTAVGDLLTGGWYSPYVIKQLLSQSWALPWLTDFWLQDVAAPFAVALVTVAAVVVARRSATQRVRLRRPSDDTVYLAMCVAGLLLTSWAARLHDGGYANVSMPAHAALSVVLGILLARVLGSARVGPVLVGSLAAALLVQVAVMTLWRLDVVPTSEDRAAGDRFLASLQALPGRVLVPTHPYYLRMAHLPTHASSIAIYDLLHAKGGREALGASLPWSLDGVSAVVLDNGTDVQLFGGALTSQFTLVTSTFVPDGVFLPVTDVPTHPALLYVRSSSLPSS